jgi:ribonuclease HII
MDKSASPSSQQEEQQQPRVPRKKPEPLAWCLVPDRFEAGVDEAGRGCLAGPVCAAAVAWPSGAEAEARLRADPRMSLVRDSKKLSPAQRAKARAFIEAEAAGWGVGWAMVAEVDEVNVLHASMRAMRRAIDALHDRLASNSPSSSDPSVPKAPDALLIDGNRFSGYISPITGEFLPHACVVEGDGRYLSIAAASVLAKTHRDAHVVEVMHPAHPDYGWAKNKCYGTPDHLAAIASRGAVPGHHRMTFRPLNPAAAAVPRPPISCPFRAP